MTDAIRTIRETGRKPGRPLTVVDAPVIKSGVMGYLEWRKARGLSTDSLWVDKVRAGMLEAGLPVRRAIAARRPEGAE